MELQFSNIISSAPNMGTGRINALARLFVAPASGDPARFDASGSPAAPEHRPRRLRLQMKSPRMSAASRSPSNRSRRQSTSSHTSARYRSPSKRSHRQSTSHRSRSSRQNRLPRTQDRSSRQNRSPHRQDNSPRSPSKRSDRQSTWHHSSRKTISQERTARSWGDRERSPLSARLRSRSRERRERRRRSGTSTRDRSSLEREVELLRHQLGVHRASNFLWSLHL